MSTSIVITCALASTIYGLVVYSITPNAFKESYEIQDSYEMQIKVDWNNQKNQDIYYVANVIYDRLNNFDFLNSDVSVIDNSNISVSIPIISISSELKDKFSLSNQEDLFREVLTFQTSLTSKKNLEFRTIEGNQLFTLNQDGQVNFNEPAPPPEEEQPMTLSSNDLLLYEDFFTPYDIQLFSDAKIEYNNGVPYAKLKTATNDIWTEMLKMGEALPNLYDAETNPYGNEIVLWFGYEEFNWIAKTIDPDGYAAVGNDPLTYAFTDSNGEKRSTPIPLAEPFLVGSWVIEQSFSVFETGWIPITAQLTSTEVNSLVNDIKFADNKFELEVISTNLSLSKNTSSSINWIQITLLVLLLIMGLLMFWWFGLLGMIAASINGILILSLFGFLSLMAIPLTSSILIALGLISLLGFIFSFYLLKEIKKEKTHTEKGFKKLFNLIKNYNNKTTPVVVVLLLLLVFFAVIIPPSIKLIFYFIILGFILNFFYIYFATIPLLILMDLIFKFSQFTNSNNKWDIVTGLKKSFSIGKFNNLIEKGSTKTTVRVFTITTLTLTVVGFMTFGILFAITGSGTNNQYLYDGYYKYDVVLTTRISEDDLVGNENPDDPYNQKTMITQINNDSSKIKNIFSEKGVNVFETNTIRNDNHFLWQYLDPNGINEDKYDYSFAYGLSIQSKTKMNSQQIIDINNELSQITTQWGSYELNETFSLTDISSVTSIDSYSVDKNSMLQFLGILLAILTTIIFMIIFFKWDGGIISLLLTAIETLASFGLTVILFAPFTPMFWFGLFTIITISIVTKSIIMTLVKSKMDKIKKIKVKNVFIYYKEETSKIVLPLLFSMIGILFLLMIPLMFIGIIDFGMLGILLCGFIIIFISNIFVFPLVAAKGYELRKRIYKKRLNLDILESEEENIIDEEYVKGINK